MNEPWYEVVDGATSLTQGDLVFGCPLLTWDPTKLPQVSGEQEAEVLKDASVGFKADVVVITQACDLEHGKVKNVVLCPHISISTYRAKWNKAMTDRKQEPTDKAFKGTCEDIAEGYIWNHAFLNSSDVESFKSELRLVDFHEIFTVPRSFLESLLQQRNVPRLRLRPPYREHLSQAFARFFMRVGLPTALDKPWKTATAKS